MRITDREQALFLVYDLLMHPLHYTTAWGVGRLVHGFCVFMLFCFIQRLLMGSRLFILLCQYITA